MKVAVVGASGNVGTGVLRALAAEPAVTSILGLARRLPPTTVAPYDAAEWVSVDIAEPADGADAEQLVVDRLASVLSGADAVIHLAWAIQPNTDRDYLRRVNVEGTRRVALASARAGVRHLVVASSWAVYSPATDDRPRDETWPNGGIPSSHYSVDKAAQERVLDELEAANPDLVVSRIRMALIFQGDAGAEIVRFFLGPFVPLRLLRPGALPVLPMPRGVRLQAVHADDVGRAYATVVRERAGGPFNVAAADTLWPEDLARIFSHGRLVLVPPSLVRLVLHYAWRARLFASDAGWLDMGTGVPVMDTGRIRALGWSETRSAESALLELLEGIRDLRGTQSPVLRPRERSFAGADEQAHETSEGDGVPLLPRTALGARIPDHIDAPLLGLYLSDHLTGATAGLSRIERMAEAYADTPMAEDLTTLAAQIGEERDLLVALIDLLGVRRRAHRQAAAWAVEHVGRLKLNKRVLHRSPLTPVLETELMRSAVLGKLGVWQTLAEHAEDLRLPREPFTRLAELSREHAEILDRLHATQIRTAFRRPD